MKFCVYILKASIAILLFSMGLYVVFYCMDGIVLDPIEVESVGMFIYTLFGIILSLILIRRAANMRIQWFIAGFVVYLLLWVFPAIFSSCYMLLLMTAG